MYQMINRLCSNTKMRVAIFSLLTLLLPLGGATAQRTGGKGGNSVALPSYNSGTVSVRGYLRTDGNYVQPHYRSAPDGNFYNNWSASGNVNPYTGKDGSKIAPPTDYGFNRYIYVPQGHQPAQIYTPPQLNMTLPPSYRTNSLFLPRFDMRTARPAVVPNRQPSIASNQTFPQLPFSSAQPRSSEAFDEQLRIDSVARLKNLGYDLTGQFYSASQLLDIELRIQSSNRLRSLGTNWNWQEHSASEMLDAELRIQAANRLNQKGYNLDWHKYTTSQLLGFELHSNSNYSPKK